MNAHRYCDGCKRKGEIELEVIEIKNSILFVNDDIQKPAGWASPSYIDENLHHTGINREDIFCSKKCMYRHYGVK
jgi:hypothetical protein